MSADVREKVAAQIVRGVAELPDRTSPEDSPMMMLVSEDELFDIAIAALREAGWGAERELLQGWLGQVEHGDWRNGSRRLSATLIAADTRALLSAAPEPPA